MRRFTLYFFAAYLIVSFAFFGFAVSQASADDSGFSGPAKADVSPIPDNPSAVKVGIYVLNLGRLDTSIGAFTVDFYLALDTDNATDPGYFEFGNGRATSTDKSVDEPGSKFYRIQASLANDLDMSRYPFDSHTLTIEIEDKERTVNALIYQPDLAGSGLDPAVKLSGWAIDGWTAEVNDHYYAQYDTTFSRYIFKINIHRVPLAGVMKTLFPAFIIVIVGLLSLVLAPDKIVPRLTLNTGAFTAAVLFHLTMNSSLPPLGYLTLGDRFMLFNYLALAMALVSTLVALRFVDRKQEKMAQRVHNIALAVIPAVWIILVLLNFFVF